MSLPVFDLTPLTRGAAAERRAVIKTFEVKVQTLVVAAISALPGLLVTFMLWKPLGTSAVLALPIVILSAIWLFTGRSSKGMKLRNWQTLQQRVTSDNGKFYVSGEEYDPLETRSGVIYQRSAPTTTSAARR